MTALKKHTIIDSNFNFGKIYNANLKNFWRIEYIVLFILLLEFSLYIRLFRDIFVGRSLNLGREGMIVL